MKSIGEILRSSRKNQKITLSELAETTKIKPHFINLIEKEDWHTLPPFPILIGFVKSIAAALLIDEKLATSTLKRDYPPKKIRIEPKPDVSSKFSWSPKATFIVGITFVFLVIFGYLGIQYKKFVSPPYLSLESPKEEQIVTDGEVVVFGSTDADAQIMINNQLVKVDDNGKYAVTIGVSESTKEIVVIATSRSGKVTQVHRKIVVQ